MHIMMAINDRLAAHKQMRSLTARFFQSFIVSKAARFGGKKPVAALTYTLDSSAAIVFTCMFIPSMWRICASVVNRRSHQLSRHRQLSSCLLGHSRHSAINPLGDVQDHRCGPQRQQVAFRGAVRHRLLNQLEGFTSISHIPSHTGHGGHTDHWGLN